MLGMLASLPNFYRQLAKVILCSVLPNMSETEAGNEDNHRDCDLQWTEARFLLYI